jgi:hypothetical protein
MVNLVIAFITFLSCNLFCKELCSEKKIIICGVGKNVESGFKNIMNSSKELVKNFSDYRIIIYENNSTDQTKVLYSQWAKEDLKIRFISEILSSNFLRSFYPNNGNVRTKLISRARNIVLSEALKTQYDDFDYIMMVDLDDFEAWDVPNILDTIENPQKQWDAVFANGAYDMYAFRAQQYKFGPELLGFEEWQDVYKIYGQKLSQELQKGNWFKVESAFGGLAIYRREALKGSSYDGMLSKEQIDEIINGDFRGDVANSSFSQEVKRKIVRNRSILIDWMDDDCSNTSKVVRKNDTYDFYVCEHVVLHYRMRKKGFDRLYINPHLIHKSKFHKNF